LTGKTTTEAFMTSTGQFGGGMLSIIGFIALSTVAFAEGSGSGSSAGGKQDTQPSQQQRSDKKQQGQTSQGSETRATQSGNTGADLSSGRDSHLGPHDSQEGQMQKKGMKGGGSAGR
jgi:hypothetical protein